MELLWVSYPAVLVFSWTAGFVVLIEFLDLSYELLIGCNVVWWRYYGCVSIYKGQLTFVTFL